MDEDYYQNFFMLLPFPTVILENERIVSCNLIFQTIFSAKQKDSIEKYVPELKYVWDQSISFKDIKDKDFFHKKTKKTFQIKTMSLQKNINVLIFVPNISVNKNKTAENSNLLNSIIAHMPGHVYWKDTNGIYLGCNDRQAKSLGLEKGSDVIGKSDFDLPWDKNSAKIFRENDLYVMQGNNITAEENTIIGHEHFVMLSYKTPLRNENKKISGVIGISIDITNEKTANELKIKNALLEEEKQHAIYLAEKMQALAATIAHELRTPLAVIKMAASSATDFFNGFETDSQEISKKISELTKTQTDILNEVNYTNKIINLILENFKGVQIEQKDFESCSIKSAVIHALERFPIPKKYKQKIHMEIKEDFFYLGKEMLSIHVLFNLLKNALYYMQASEKGEIFIWTETNKDSNKLYFKDTSQGIAEDILPFIFDKFFSRTYHGTGVGLSFCKDVMIAYNGYIICDSIEGEFTQFELGFPSIN